MGAKIEYIGVDGCRAGWFYVGLAESEAWDMGVAAKVSDLLCHLNKAKLILIDIPIGLREKEKQERLCDAEARRILGRARGGSVFPAPVRRALKCSTYEQASEMNKQHTGRALSRQSWNIVGRINEIDELMHRHKNRRIVKEMHPEICFWGLNKRRVMRYSKKTKEGFSERLNVLRRHCSVSDLIVDGGLGRFMRREVLRDDILDALSGAVTARLWRFLATVPAEPEVDSLGLPMEMVYARV